MAGSDVRLYQGEASPNDIRLRPVETLDAYATEVAADAPVAYWRLDESGGPVVYDSVDGHLGTAVNGPTFGAPSLLAAIPGDLAVTFASASTQYVSVSPWSNEGTGDFSAEAWFKTSTGGSLTLVSHKADPTVGNPGWVLVLSAGLMLWRISDGATQRTATSALTYNDGLAHHVVGTYSASAGLILYIDGANVATALSTGSLAPSLPLTIGVASNLGSNPFDGTLDEVAYYNYVLTGTRVLAHYNAGIGAGASPQTVSLGLVGQTAVTFAPVISTTVSVSLGLITQTAATFGPFVTTLTTVTLGLITQTAAPFAPTVTTLTVVILGLIDQTGVTFAPTVAVGSGTQPIELALIDQTASPFAPVISTTVGVTLGLITQTAAPFAPVLSTTYAISLGLISQPATSFSPAITTGPVTLSLGFIDQTAQPFAPVVTTLVSVTLGLISQPASTFAPVVVQGGPRITLALIDQGAHTFAITVSGGGGKRKGLYPLLVLELKEERELVVAHALMDSLVSQYGTAKGEEVYFRMERERRGPFAAGNKYGRSYLGPRSPDRARTDREVIAEFYRRQKDKVKVP